MRTTSVFTVSWGARQLLLDMLRCAPSEATGTYPAVAPLAAGEVPTRRELSRVSQPSTGSGQPPSGRRFNYSKLAQEDMQAYGRSPGDVEAVVDGCTNPFDTPDGYKAYDGVLGTRRIRVVVQHGVVPPLVIDVRDESYI